MDSVQRLEAKQVWKVDRGYVQIVEVGKRLVHYKLLQKPEQRRAPTLVANQNELLRYLEHNKAKRMIRKREGRSSARKNPA
jgi:hypothetical protein